ncbi:alpha/beta fold hydrolase [Nocardia goodfellowii]|uniref:Pimeloyl-ACP methyl ester carboxylesterase n=1 Tax=Nocardia goodfellowii TaxID=882446 RepID=A0ABS4QDD4_9NOCA|nr:alpha/beta hydrolase [Nocardia goodfellowii]MBP2189700.1 pimeloyl-ACP methyl ester carboxylesterase [Nocardia goodfellowii]
MTSVLDRAAAFDRDHETVSLRAGGHEWTYYRGGEGTPVLLLPGGAGIAISWLDLTPALRPGYRTLTVDYPPGPTTLEELADGVLGILDAEHIDSIHVIGQSAGGMLAEVLSQRAPARVRSLVLTSTGLYGPEDLARLRTSLARTRDTPWDDTLAAIGHSLRKTWKDAAEADFWVERVGHATRTAGQQGAVTSYRRLLDAAQRLTDLHPETPWHGPALIIRAADDPLITAAHTQRLQDLHPDAELLVFPDGGHSLLLSRPADYVDAVTDFWKRHCE